MIAKTVPTTVMVRYLSDGDQAVALSFTTPAT
jgi:hypothetical protein